MHFQVRTGSHIRNSDAMVDGLRAQVEGTLLSQFGDRLRRVEVYFQDTNGHKLGVDIRCSVEVHLAGYPAVAVDAVAPALDEAFDAALDKAHRALESKLGRIEGRGGRVSMSGEAT